MSPPEIHSGTAFQDQNNESLELVHSTRRLKSFLDSPDEYRYRICINKLNRCFGSRLLTVIVLVIYKDYLTVRYVLNFHSVSSYDVS